MGPDAHSGDARVMKGVQEALLAERFHLAQQYIDLLKKEPRSMELVMDTIVELGSLSNNDANISGATSRLESAKKLVSNIRGIRLPYGALNDVTTKLVLASRDALNASKKTVIDDEKQKRGLIGRFLPVASSPEYTAQLLDAEQALKYFNQEFV